MENQLWLTIVKRIMELDYDYLETNVLKDQKIGPKTKQSIFRFKQYIQNINLDHSEIQNNFNYYKKVVRELGEKDNLQENYIDTDLLISRDIRDNIRPLFKKINERRNAIRAAERQTDRVKVELQRCKNELNQLVRELSMCRDQQTDREEQLLMKCREIQEELEVSKKREFETRERLQDEIREKEMNLALVEELRQTNEALNEDNRRTIAELEAEKDGLTLDLAKLKKFVVNLQQMNQEKEMEIGELEKKTMEVGEAKDRKITELEGQVEQLVSKSAISCQTMEQCQNLFVRTNSILSFLGMNQLYSTKLLNYITELTGGQPVRGLNCLYNFNLQRKDNPHNSIDFRENILLVCLTQDKDIVGGYTSAGFSLQQEKEEAKAFLFSMREGEMMTFPLKGGRASTKYDRDYIIFGNEELCLENGSNQLSSYLVDGPAKSLHYLARQSEKLSFLAREEGRAKVRLDNYEIVQVIFDDQ